MDNDYAVRFAAKHGHLKVVKYLYSVGANIHAKDNYAVRFAAKHDFLHVVRYLSARGAHNQSDIVHPSRAGLFINKVSFGYT